MLYLMQDLVRFMMTVPGDFMQENMPAHFRYVYVMPGDIVYVPGGSMLMEKCVISDNIVLRVPSPLVTQDAVDSIRFSAAVSPILVLMSLSVIYVHLGTWVRFCLISAT